MKPYERIQYYWSRTNSGISTISLSESDVGAFESKYKLLIPLDFRNYLLRSCPVKDSPMDNDLTRWWHLEEIKTIPEEYEHTIKNPIVAKNPEQYLVFADWSIWAWTWAIACGRGEHHGRVVVINGVDDRFVADNFGEFIENYVQNIMDVS